jgi:diguanylate cyclase (GGDEF)-like protein
LNVLVVGDKAEERALVVGVVSELGHTVWQAEDGEEGLRAYRRRAFDIVISDFIMPKMNGLELCRQIRQQPQERYTYVLVASKFSEKQHILAGFEAGVDDYVGKPIDVDELRVRLISAVRVARVHAELASKNRELAEAGASLLAETRRDPLTNVGNRLRFQDDVERMMDEVRRYQHRYCLGMCDIDNFKQYNDTYGHLAGDQVLRSVAQTLQDKSRASDQVYRFGGEEFLLVFPDQDEASAMIAAQRLRREVEKLDIVHVGNAPYGRVTLTIGLALFQARSAEEVDRDLQAADKLLYHGKLHGRNQVVSRLTLAQPGSAGAASEVSKSSS